jgi:hypothetical protein
MGARLPTPLALCLTLALGSGCAINGRSSLVTATPEPVGPNCPYGGMRIDIGLDDDGNGLLERREVDASSFLCNQRVDGRSIAVRTAPETAGANCPAGGIRVETGLDDDDDRTLDSSEVDATAYVCDGADGFTTLVALVAIDPDLTRPICPLGGTRIESGRDLDRDGTLAEAEVESFASVCSIRTNENLFLVDNAVELPGANCPAGGTRTRFGIDDDGDHVLDPEEVDGAPAYLCNEVQLIAGKSSLVTTEPASIAECTFGGYAIRHGLDDDYDGTLDAGELDGLRIVCNGNEGYAGLVEQDPFVGGECGQGVAGIELASGLDTDRDGHLDTNEVTARETVCDGLDGPPGPAALVVQTDGAPHCADGITITTGTDWDLDTHLDSDEIDFQSEVCPGPAGHDALVEVYDDGGECAPDPGVLLRVGTDWNDSGHLEGSEYEEVLVCGAS